MYTYPKTYRNPLTKAQLDAISVFAVRLAPDTEDELWALIRALDSFLSYHLNDFKQAFTWITARFHNKEQVLNLGRGPRTRANTLRAMYDAENKTEAPAPQAKRTRTIRKAAPKAEAPAPQSQAPKAEANTSSDAMHKAFDACPQAVVNIFNKDPDGFSKKHDVELVTKVLMFIYSE